MIEEHLTFETNNKKALINIFRTFEIKIIEIELDTNERQLMTSNITSIYDVILKKTKALNTFSKIYCNKNDHKIIRTKYETSPKWFLKNKDKYNLTNLYNESHLRVKLTKDNSEIINSVCAKYNLHRSRNLFKKVNENYSLLMLTLRRNDLSLDNFQKLVNYVKIYLTKQKIEYDKVEVEVCIMDSNIDLDKNWIK